MYITDINKCHVSKNIVKYLIIVEVINLGNYNVPFIQIFDMLIPIIKLFSKL